jgi:hypothetical protein
MSSRRIRIEEMSLTSFCSNADNRARLAFALIFGARSFRQL